MSLKKSVRPQTIRHAVADRTGKRIAKGHVISRNRTPETEDKYLTLDGKLRLLDTIVKSKWVEPSEKVKLQCLGITFGDALAQQLGLKWVAVEDERGRDPALQLEGTSVILFPLTMISKRIERGEEVDVYQIFHGICAKLQELKQQKV